MAINVIGIQEANLEEAHEELLAGSLTRQQWDAMCGDILLQKLDKTFTKDWGGQDYNAKVANICSAV